MITDRKECILVLGAKTRDGSPGKVLKSRLDGAIAYIRREVSSPFLVIVSGRSPEAEVMARYLSAHGISEEDILLESMATSTVENLTCSTALIPRDSELVLVTSEFHVTRTKYIAKRLNFRFSRVVAAKTPLLSLPKAVLREILALSVLPLKKCPQKRRADVIADEIDKNGC